MIRGKIDDLIRRLIEKTRKQELQWEKTSSDTQYKLLFPNNSFILVDSYYFELTNENFVNFGIYNKLGDTVEVYQYSENSSTEYNLIMNLYSAIRGDDRVISDILNYLK